MPRIAPAQNLGALILSAEAPKVFWGQGKKMIFLLLWRLRFRRRDDEAQEVFPAFKAQNPEGASQLVPILFSRAELSPALFRENIRQFKNLVHKKSKEIQDKKIKRQIFFPMSEIMFKMIPLVFKSVESLILNLPPGPSSSCHMGDVKPIHREIGYPAIAIGDFPVDFNAVLEIVHMDGVGICV